jgi:acyl-CoA thioester hydrolase
MPQEPTFRVGRRDAKMHVADNMAWSREHAISLTLRGERDKPSRTGASAVPSRHFAGMAFETISELRVRYAETDQMGVVYHANYLVWCEIGRTDFIRHAGRSYADLEREGVLLAVSDASLRFHASARYDDPIKVVTALSAVGSRGMSFDYRIERADTGATLVRAATSLVCINREGRLATLPREVRGWLEAAMRGERPSEGDDSHV